MFEGNLIFFTLPRYQLFSGFSHFTRYGAAVFLFLQCLILVAWGTECVILTSKFISISVVFQGERGN